MHTITDESTVFDTSLTIYDIQAGAITWESVPDGWDHSIRTGSSAANASASPEDSITYTKGEYYPGGDATATVRCDKVGTVEGRPVSLRLTFSNITASAPCVWDSGSDRKSTIGIKERNVWKGIWLCGIDTLDMKIELLDYETGDQISLKGAWFTGSSLNASYDSNYNVAKNNGISQPERYNIVRGEACRYLTDDDYDSYTKQSTGLAHSSDGTWYGSRGKYASIESWEDFVGGKNFLCSSVAFGIVDDTPSFRLQTANSRHTKFCLNFSPLTLEVPNTPVKTVSIGEGETTGSKALADGIYTLFSSYSDELVLDVTDGSTSNGAKIQSWKSNGTQAQQWKITTDANGISTIVNVGSGKALNLTSGKAENGNQLQIWGSGHDANSQWKIVPWGDGYKIVSVVDEKYVIDLAGASTSQGAAIQIYKDNGTAAQTWTPVEGITEGTYTISNYGITDMVWDIKNSGTSNGSKVCLYESTGAETQQWKIAPDSKGISTITNVKSGKALDLTDGKAENGNQLQIWGISDGESANANKLWKLVPRKDGYKIISTVDEKYVADLKSNSSRNGAHIQAYEANGTSAQRWQFNKVK